MGAGPPEAEGSLVMKPAEIVTAVVSVPVVAAFIVSALAGPAERPAPAAITVEAPAATVADNVAEEIVVIAKRAVANTSS